MSVPRKIIMDPTLNDLQRVVDQLLLPDEKGPVLRSLQRIDRDRAAVDIASSLRHTHDLKGDELAEPILKVLKDGEYFTSQICKNSIKKIVSSSDYAHEAQDLYTNKFKKEIFTGVNYNQAGSNQPPTGLIEAIVTRLPEISGSELKAIIAIYSKGRFLNTGELMDITGMSRKTCLNVLKSEHVRWAFDYIQDPVHEIRENLSTTLKNNSKMTNQP